MTKLRKFTNGKVTLTETPQDNLFYFSRNDKKCPSEMEAMIAFCVLYRNVLVGPENAFNISCEYEEERNHIRITVRDSKTQIMPSLLKRSKDSRPEPSFI